MSICYFHHLLIFHNKYLVIFYSYTLVNLSCRRMKKKTTILQVPIQSFLESFVGVHPSFLFGDDNDVFSHGWWTWRTSFSSNSKQFLQSHCGRHCQDAYHDQWNKHNGSNDFILSTCLSNCYDAALNRSGVRNECEWWDTHILSSRQAIK